MFHELGMVQKLYTLFEMSIVLQESENYKQ